MQAIVSKTKETNDEIVRTIFNLFQRPSKVCLLTSIFSGEDVLS
jgi:hypothetical protein